MAISVVCPTCRASFRVDDKYAGRQGPCPKCKATITIPKVDKVTIHEETTASTTAAAAASGKPAKSGAQSIRPIARTETEFKIVPAVLIALGVAVVILGTWLLSETLVNHPWLRVPGLLLVAIPGSIGSYAILRNDELEPYRGGPLWWRAIILGFIYTLMWIGVAFIPQDLRTELLNWAIILPALVLAGGGMAMVLFDLDFGSAVFHYLLYFAATVLLGYLAGLGWPWQALEAVEAILAA